MRVAINPGSGPVQGATLENAMGNMGQFIVDLGGNGWVFSLRETTGHEGRWRFDLICPDGSRYGVIDMPGLPLDRVRFTGAKGQDIWDYPRLYENGNSWVWKYALNVVGREEREEEDD